jgi:hypothetical protein
MQMTAEPLGYCPHCRCGGGHIPGCPNEYKPDLICEICGKEILCDEPYINYHGIYHSDCFIEKFEEKR